MRLWHLTSLDAPTVAVVWALSFAWSAGIKLPLWVLALLALATWTVYVADRLLDARAGLRMGETDQLRMRHHFHWRHRPILIPLAFVSGCTAAVMAIALMPAAAREGNTVLAAAAFVYFTRVHSASLGGEKRIFSPTQLSFRFPLKESLVALLFTCACALPAFSRLHNSSALWPLAAAIGFFAFLAFVNCVCIEHWESDSKPSASNSFGSNPTDSNPTNSNPSSGSRTFYLAGGLGLLGILLAAFEFSIHPHTAELIAAGAASALLLAWLDRFQNRLSPLALRAAADLVLLAPIALLMR